MMRADGGDGFFPHHQGSIIVQHAHESKSCTSQRLVVARHSGSSNTTEKATALKKPVTARNPDEKWTLPAFPTRSCASGSIRAVMQASIAPPVNPSINLTTMWKPNSALWGGSPFFAIMGYFNCTA
mmetsp:Transcript_14833/g.28029  ORF Transcript_14833/g.28029 Transcript_14833/m.28029 type:complete len:126 (+) Transcript_14833:1-378(+)